MLRLKKQIDHIEDIWLITIYLRQPDYKACARLSMMLLNGCKLQHDVGSVGSLRKNSSQPWSKWGHSTWHWPDRRLSASTPGWTNRDGFYFKIVLPTMPRSMACWRCNSYGLTLGVGCDPTPQTVWLHCTDVDTCKQGFWSMAVQMLNVQPVLFCDCFIMSAQGCISELRFSIVREPTRVTYSVRSESPIHEHLQACRANMERMG